MKKLFTSACSVAMLFLFSFANAQTQDTTLAKVDLQRNKVNDNVVKRTTTFDEIRTAEQSERPAAAKFVVPFNSTDRKSTPYLLDSKVGPNGEDLLNEGDELYYLDVNGNKIKAKASELKEKAKHS